MEKGISDLMNAQTPPPRLPLARSLRTIEWANTLQGQIHFKAQAILYVMNMHEGLLTYSNYYKDIIMRIKNLHLYLGADSFNRYVPIRM